MTRSTLARLCLAAAGFSLALPSLAEPIVIGETASLTSAVLGEERSLMIHLPESYARGDGRYPVLYLLDANTNFFHTVGTLTALARVGQVPEMIVVAVDNTDRTRDLTPTNLRTDPELPPGPENQDFPTSGGADAFLDFFRQELLPWVEGRYRTAPHRVLVGHSFGGLFAVHALLTQPDLFDGYLAISPSLWWDKGMVLEEAEPFLAAPLSEEKGLFLTLANEGGHMLANYEGFVELLEYRAPEGLSWSSRMLEGDDHGTVPVRSTYLGLKALFPRWRAPGFARQEGLDGLLAHFADLSERYGFTVRPPEGMINGLGYQALGDGDAEGAVEIFRHNVESYPHSANVYDSLGEGLEARGDLAAARESYAKAIRLGEEAVDPNLGIYRQHLEGVEAKLVGTSETDG